MLSYEFNQQSNDRNLSLGYGLSFEDSQMIGLVVGLRIFSGGRIIFFSGDGTGGGDDPPIVIE